MSGQRAEVLRLLGGVFDAAVMRRNVDVVANALQEIALALIGLARAEIPLLAIAGDHEYGHGREAGALRVLETLGLQPRARWQRARGRRMAPP